MIKVGSDFSGVGAFDFALGRIKPFETVFACDWDKYARLSYIANHGEPPYYPSDVYDREIPSESLDIYMTSPPCQSFSLAGKREGKNSDKGILFFNSHEFIQKNKPRFFIFENVKGLLSDDEGKTFQEWVNMLGGKSVNGLPILFPYENSVPYHLYWQVLNSKKHGVPQNRERVFLVGIRDDEDNQFQFPKEEHLTKRLKDVLEEEVDEKYFLSEKIQKQFIRTSENGSVIGTTKPIFRTIGERDNVHNPESYMSCLTATENDSINFSVPNSETRRGRVGKEVAQTLDTQCNQGVMVYNIPEIVSVRKHQVRIIELQQLLKKHRNISIKEISEKLNIPKTQVEHWFRTDKCFSIPDPVLWLKLKECINISTNEFDLEITEFENKESIFEKSNRVYDSNGIAPTLTSTSADERVLNDYKIRRLTPRECFRLQDFPDTFKFVVSDSQLYKQAGNSITVRVLEKILRNLKL
jgi:DNA (cytosine-5)-methyltransferase 1